MNTTPLRLSDARFLLAWLLPLLTLSSLVFQPQRAVLGALVVWATVALLDALWAGGQRSPPPGPDHAGLRWLLRLYVPLQLLMIGVGAWAASRAQSGWEIAGLALAVGFVTGAQGITYAHELGHSRHRADRVLAWVLMASVGYAHFMVEHYRGHHPRAATWDDPASARRGESLWRFLPRTLAGSWASAWRLEALRLGQHRLRWWHSPLAWATGLTLAVAIVFIAAGAMKFLAFWVLQSVFAIWLLETVNYIEHYGLQRAAPATGVREPFGLNHAWNADHVMTNSLLANLQRHSDHHMHAWKPFAELEALPGPQLPTGYAGCLLLAALPPVWFSLMHPRLSKLAAAQGLFTSKNSL